MSKRRKKIKRKRITLVIIFVLVLIITSVFFVLKKLSFNKPDDSKYKISKNATSLMKENYDLLKLELEKEKIDYKKYAEYLSKLFITDLYTLNNKDNKYDVSSSYYVYPSDVKNYKVQVQDSLYKYLTDKDKRKEKLAIVNKIEMKNISEETYTAYDKEFDAYRVSLNWEYTKDFGYDNKADVIVIKQENKMYVASVIPEVADE